MKASKEIGARTRLLALIGDPVAHSSSPAMHNAALSALGEDLRYLAFAVRKEELGEAIAGLRALGVAGANVTVPHKEAVIPLLDEVEPEARAIGAVNTILREGDRLIGANTDAEGLCRSLREEGLVLEGAKVLILGAGGAARAAAVGLRQAGAEALWVAARRPEQAERLCSEVSAALEGAALEPIPLENAPPLRQAASQATIVVQATSATLGDPEAARAFVGALPWPSFSPGSAAVELVYTPRRTLFLRRAEERGQRTVEGLGMLLHQGALALERWIGRPAPLEIMREALERSVPESAAR